MTFHLEALPVFPWDTLSENKARAAQHPGGVIDLSIGTPIDEVPEAVQRAFIAGANSPGYPPVEGSTELRADMVNWYARNRDARLETDQVLPTVGSKELIGMLPSLLGIGPGDTVVYPRVAYPTYEVGAKIAGAQGLAADDIAQWPESTRLVWLNSPSNPTGGVLSASQLREILAAAKARNIVVASDECYAELIWSVPQSPSVLSSEVCDDDHEGILGVYSLSKQSSMAGYRCGIVAGDRQLIARILQQRKHLGLMVPGPVQHAMLAALQDDSIATDTREIYRKRREKLYTALTHSGYKIDQSEAGLYLWVKKDKLDSVQLSLHFANLGVLVAPGHFYGDNEHVRIALTATDDNISQAVQRLNASQ